MTPEERKIEMIISSVQGFSRLNDDCKMFILGYMLGVQQEQQKIVYKDSQTV